jgi:rubrerythrin
MKGHDMGGDMKGHDMGGSDDAKGKKAKPAVNPKTTYTCPMHPEVRKDRPGKCPKCGMTLVPEKSGMPKSDDSGQPDHSGHLDEASPATDTTDTKDKTVYTCPMHPEVRQDRPGKCPKCGMTLVPEKKPPPP